MATAIASELQSTDLEKILELTSTSYVEPYAFFVSWQGVLTLAFAGFPPAILDMKDRIAAQHPALPPESPGSKWPKASLGCCKDGVTLAREQFNTLNQLCKNLSKELFSANNTTLPASPAAAPSLQIAIDAAAITLYECRSLEKIICQHSIPFGNGHDTTSATPEEQLRVKLIVSEADDPEYYKLVAREGNRQAHYTAPALGATLTHPLHPQKSVSSTGNPHSPRVHHNVLHMGLQQRGLAEINDRHRLFEAIQRFKSEVEKAVPGVYYWFDEKSLHITLRAIIL